MERGELITLAGRLADRWAAAGMAQRGVNMQGLAGDMRGAVLDEILAQPAGIAAALAAIVSREADELFDEGARFRSALVDRALR